MPHPHRLTDAFATNGRSACGVRSLGAPLATTLRTSEAASRQEWFSQLVDARVMLGLARSMLGFDRRKAVALTRSAFRRTFDLAFGDSAVPGCPRLPWPVQQEPILAFAYRIGQALFLAQTAIAEEALAQIEERERSARAITAYNDRVFPCASVLLERVLAGRTVRLNGHSLGFCDSFNCLVGTNPYGVDYLAGPPTLERVASWRASMAAGRTLGHCEPGAAMDDADAADHLFWDVDHDCALVRDMAGIEFDDDLLQLKLAAEFFRTLAALTADQLP